MAIGFTLPFSKSSGSIGYFDTTATDLSAVRENLKSLLLTNWGERVNHYFMGCNFKEFLFEQLDVEEFRSRIADRIISQIETWMPFVGVQTLNIILHEDDANVPLNGVGVNIEFGLLSKPELSSRLEIIVAQ